LEKRSKVKRQKKLDGFHLVIAENYKLMSRLAADLICQEIKKNVRLLFCAAAGNTPTGTYQRLAEEYGKDPALFGKFRVLKLDEWAGLDMNNPATCEAYLKKHLLIPLEIDRERYFGCTSLPEDLNEECRKMDRIMKNEGPIDLCLLGLGLNGHLGLNEPAEHVSSGWHVTTLSPESLDHPMLEISKARPSFGITLGMRDLLQSKHILLLVSGSDKKDVLKKLFEQKITASFPASFLWFHSNVTVLCDPDAAVYLKEIVS
jgi:galactosamine-6-phosphate isomerase